MYQSTADGVRDVGLAPGNWLPRNRVRLNQWLAALQSEPDAGARTAAFDWDGTCSFGDVCDSVFRFQLDHLALRITPLQLSELIPPALEPTCALPGGVSLGDARDDILEAYRQLWPALRREDPASVIGSTAHLDLRAKLAWLYQAFEHTPSLGGSFAYPWVARLLAGHTEQEARDLGAATVRAAVREPIGHVTVESATAGRSGWLMARFPNGIRPYAEIRQLVVALQARGVRVVVVSASNQQVLEGVLTELSYPIASNEVFGMRVTTDDDGKLAPTNPPQSAYPSTCGRGKVEVLQARVSSEPVLVAGDSDWDYPMLTAFAATELRLLINHNASGRLAALYDEAFEAPLRRAPLPTPVTLLQGCDDNAGTLRPALETVRCGADAPTPLESLRAGRRGSDPRGESRAMDGL